MIKDQRMVSKFHNYLQNKELSANWKIIYRSKNYLQIEEVSPDRRIIDRSELDLQSEELSVDRRVICWLSIYPQIEELSTDWRTIYIRNNYMQIVKLFSCWENCLKIYDMQCKRVIDIFGNLWERKLGRKKREKINSTNNKIWKTEKVSFEPNDA